MSNGGEDRAPPVQDNTDRAVQIREAFGDIYEKYSGRLLAIALRFAGNRSDAEDLFAETMMRTLSYLTRRDLPTGDLLPWLCTVCLNAHRDLNRRERTRQHYGLDVRRVFYDEPGRGSEVLGLSRQELWTYWREVRAYISALPKIQKASLLLKLEGHSYQEISAALRIKPEQVKNAIESAMITIRGKLRPIAEKPNK